MHERIALIAMDPSGASLVLCDGHGRVWLYPPEGTGGPRVIEFDAAEEIIAWQDMERIDREFASWAELEAFRQERAARLTPETVADVEAFDLEDVEELVAVAEGWHDDGDTDQARKLVVRLLRAPVARADPAAYDLLLAALESLEPLADSSGQPTHPRAEARPRLKELPRAA